MLKRIAGGLFILILIYIFVLIGLVALSATATADGPPWIVKPQRDYLIVERVAPAPVPAPAPAVIPEPMPTVPLRRLHLDEEPLTGVPEAPKAEILEPEKGFTWLQIIGAATGVFILFVGGMTYREWRARRRL